MQIPFTTNAFPTVGVELELHVIDPVTGNLANAAVDILGELGRGHPDNEHPKAKHELFQSTIEIITGVCRTPAEARSDLESTLAEVRAAAQERGLSLISAGTHPFGLARDQLVTPSSRYAALVEEMQWTARRLLICGTHIHVGVRSGEHAIAIVNELQRHLPLFLILSSSSPYLEAEDTGMASCRSKVFEALPTAGLPPQLRDWNDFEMFMETLIHSGCISSIREVWWDVRPHPDFGTVELRMCDATPTLREVTALTALAQSLVAHLSEKIDAGELGPPPREWSVRENRWLAARHGIDAELIVDDRGRRVPARDLLEKLVHDLAPTAGRLGAAAELADTLELWSIGPGYLRQRRITEAGGSLEDIVADLARQLDSGEPA
ncbi:MAG: glutamate--cysteine ligase [Acidimicrobiia bacterium]|nr:glutamate--cysteine ligase [Acidimicrobiia bacterium]MDH5237217.1 glutamate--cysteine ligase [Acidimicrobiia bacterium]